MTYEQAERRHAELKVELYERMAAERQGDSDVAALLAEAHDMSGALEDAA